VGDATRTEACDDKQRIDGLEKYLTTGRELANIVEDHDDSWFKEGDGMKI
jgi:hypothetical protein